MSTADLVQPLTDLRHRRQDDPGAGSNGSTQDSNGPSRTAARRTGRRSVGDVFRQRRVLVVTLSLLLAVVLGQSVVAFVTTAATSALGRRVASEFETVGTANAAAANLLEMEAEWRVYVLTGRLESLYGYVSQHTALWRTLDDLLDTPGMDADWTQRWLQTAATVEAWEREALNLGFERRQAALDGRASDADLMVAVTTHAVPQRLREIREQLRVAVEAQHSEALAHQRELEAWSTVLLLVVPIGVAICALLSAVIAFGAERARGHALTQQAEARLEGVLLAARTAEHEIGNRLALTSGYAELLARTPGLSDQQRALAEQAVAGAHEAAAIVRGLAQLDELKTVDWPELESTVDVTPR